MTKERFIELLRGLCEEGIIYIGYGGEVNFNSNRVKAYLTVEGIE